MSYLIDKVEERTGNGHDLVVHDFEEFSGEKTSFTDKIDGVVFPVSVIIGLIEEEVFHAGVVGFTEELEESEGATEGEFEIELSLYLKLIAAVVSEFFGEGFFLSVEMIVRVDRFVGEVSDFFVVFHFSDFDKEVTDVRDDAFDADEH